MKHCLNEKTLLALHGGEGSTEERVHVESCLNCARRYRQLADDLKDIVSVLKQAPPPPQTARRSLAGTGWRWSLAAAIAGLAFLLGRMTTAGILGVPRFHPAAEPAAQVASVDQELADAGDATIGSTYALYVDNLITQEDESDSSQVTEDTWTNDSDGL